MRHFKDGDELTLEPWRSRAFPVLRDLMVDRSAFDRIIQAGGFVSVNTGTAPDGNAIPISEGRRGPGDGRRRLHRLRRLRRAVPERRRAALHRRPRSRTSPSCRRVSRSATCGCESMVAQLEEEMFGSCTNYGECEAVCPKEISVDFIAQLNRDYLKAKIPPPRLAKAAGGQAEAARPADVRRPPERTRGRAR